MVEVEIFMPTGVLEGTTPVLPLANDGPDLSAPLLIGDARWFPIDGSPPSHRADGQVEPDDILIVATPPPEAMVHMTWYSVSIDIGPYRVSGRLATQPGYDPARALLRPSGGFVALRDAAIELSDQPDSGFAERPFVHVNRYAVDRVLSSLMLGFYFPGAQLITKEPVAVV